MHRIAADWQKATPYLGVLGIAVWIALFRDVPVSERSLFFGLLVIYLLHQTEEHQWPGGFRQFTNAHMFKSGKDNWPVDMGGVAFVNIGLVWVPVGLAVLFPAALRWIGLAWIGLTLVNAVIHVVTTIRLRLYNPGLVTSIVLFLPFTIFVLAFEHAHGALSGGEIALVILAGIVLHLPVAGLFVVPFLRHRSASK